MSMESVVEANESDELLDALCQLFDEELERQENVLGICKDQGDAARQHDTQRLEVRTQALVTLVEDALEAERERVTLLRRVVDHFSLPVKKQTLSDLIEIAAEPWSKRLKEFQTRIQKTLTQTRSTVLENADHIRRSLRVVDDSLNTVLGPAVVLPGAYEGDGKEPGILQREPALIDTRG